MGRKHMVGSIDRRGQQNAVFATLMDLPINLKDNEASFSTILMDMLYLRVDQMPRSPDPVIFVLTTTDTTDYFTPCAYARGNYWYYYCMLYKKDGQRQCLQTRA